MYRYLMMACCALAALSAAGANNPYEDKELMYIINWIKQADNYTYELCIKSEMKYGTKDSAAQYALIYTSHADSVRYVCGTDECSFLNKEGMFKVHRKTKQVGYRQFRSDTLIHRIMETAANDGAGKQVDSIFLLGATIRQRTKLGNVVSYKLGYRSDYMIKSMEIAFDTHAKKLISMSYVLERYLNGIHADAALVRQTVRMSQYRHQQPADLQHILLKSKELKQYLESTYASYSIHTL